MSAPIVSFEVVTFHARGAWPRFDGFDMTHSADGVATLADGSTVQFTATRHHKAGAGCDMAVTLYGKARRELTAARWDELRGMIRRAFVGHVRDMVDGPRPASIKPGTAAPGSALPPVPADVDATDALEAADAGLDATSYASPVVLPRVGGFAPTGNLAPIGRAYREGTLDSFMVAAVLDWMSPARLAQFFARWGAPPADKAPACVGAL